MGGGFSSHRSGSMPKYPGGEERKILANDSVDDEVFDEKEFPIRSSL